jgi:single-strand DNA-binding protein
VFEIDVDEVGPSMKYATAKVTKTSRSGGGQGFTSGGSDDPWASNQSGQGGSGSQIGSQGGQNGGWGGQQGAGANPGGGSSDPWATSGGSGGHQDEPPF